MGNSDMDDIQNMVRLHCLLARYGVKILKTLFLQRYQLITGKQWENGSKTERQAFLGRYCASKLQNDYQEWDITFLASILLKMQSNDTATSEDKSKLDDENETIRRLRDLRNNIVHHARHTLSKEIFDLIWSNAQNLLTSLGVRLEDIEHIRTTSKLDGIEFNSGDINQESMVKSTLLREEGNVAVRSNKTTEGINLYSKALLLIGLSQTERATLLSNRSYAHLKLIQDKRNPSVDEMREVGTNALVDARLAMELRPSWWKGYSRAGNVHKFMKEFKKAIDYFEYALCLNPPVPQSVRNARDECRIDADSEQILEHLDPCYTYTSSKEVVDKMFKTRGVKLERIPIDFIKDILKSEDQELKTIFYTTMAHKYLHGDEVPLDKEKAASFFQKAADAGVIEGMYMLGYMYFTGQGKTRDINRAVRLFEKGSKESYSANPYNIGIAESKYMLGKCYDLGAVYDKNYTTASEWYRKASLEGLGNASHNLGFLYSNGLGVETNSDRAIQYWKLAVEQGCVNAMVNLCEEFMALLDIKQAETWFQRSIVAEHSIMTTQSDKYENKFTEMKRRFQTINENLPAEFAAICPTPNLLKQLTKKNIPEFKKIMEIMQNDKNAQPLTTNETPKYWASYPEICKRADEGGRFAEKIRTAINHCARGQEYLNDLQTWESLISQEHKVWMKEKILEDFAISYESAGFVAFLPNCLIQKFKELIQAALQKSTGESQRNARVCHLYLLGSSLDEGKKYAEILKSKYPNDSYFYNMHASFLGFLHDYKEGVSVTTEGLALFPDDYELLYCRAVHLRGCPSGSNFEAQTVNSHVRAEIKARNKKSFNLTKSAYEKFIEKAPKDHRKVPESFYSMAVLSVNIGMVEKANQYYQQGLDAEKHLLSCFLPYASPMKTIAKQFRKLYIRTDGLSKIGMIPLENLLEEDVEDSEKRRNLKSTNPKRIVITTKFRENSANSVSLLSKTWIKSTCEGLHVQRAPQRKTDHLKEITFDEMDPTIDHVYQDAAINLTIFEDSLYNVFPSIPSVVKDDNGDFQTIYFYNLNHNDAIVRKNLSFGSRIRIKNPYFRLTSDRGVGIRVDDPKSIEYLSSGDEKSLCRFCWKENAKKKCRACGRGYCSAKCLKKDRELLHHEFICNNSK